MRTKTGLRAGAGIAALALATVTMTACGRSSGSSSGGGYTVGVAWSTLSTPYFASLKAGLDQAAKAAGIKLVEVQANNDASQQLNQLNQLQTQHVDLLVVNPVDASTIVGGIKQAATSGTKVLTIDRMVPGAGSAVLAHVGASAEQAGYEEAQAVCKAEGKNAKYLGIWGLPGNQTTRDRVAGVKRGAKAGGCNLQLVAEKYETGETTQAAADTTANWLEKYTQGQVNAIITYADSQAAGALQELKTQHRTDIVVTGAANFGPFHDAICTGNKQALATVDFAVDQQGKTLLQTIEKVRDKQSLPKWVQTKEVVVTPQNRATCTS